MLEWFDRIQHNIVHSHTLCQYDLIACHTAFCGENAHRASGKYLQQEEMDLLGRESITKVRYRRIAVLKRMLLYRDEQLGPMHGEGEVDEDTYLVTMPFP